MEITEAPKLKVISLQDANQKFLVEAVVHEGDRIEGVSAESATEKSLKSALVNIREIAASVASVAIPENVQEASVELGFQFDASGSIYLVSTKATASIKLTLKLKK